MDASIARDSFRHRAQPSSGARANHVRTTCRACASFFGGRPLPVRCRAAVNDSRRDSITPDWIASWRAEMEGARQRHAGSGCRSCAAALSACSPRRHPAHRAARWEMHRRLQTTRATPPPSAAAPPCRVGGRSAPPHSPRARYAAAQAAGAATAPDPARLEASQAVQWVRAAQASRSRPS
eukprot:scaffold112195_cov75-Phaeocystis_antarctica.AAC.1